MGKFCWKGGYVHEGLEAQGGYLEMPQAGQEAISTDKPITKCLKNMSEAGYRLIDACV